MLKAVFFDLDGTLLPLDEGKFINLYFKLLTEKLLPFGYEPNKLIDTIWAGTQAMYENNGKYQSNENAFWNVFKSIYGENKLKDKPVIDSFYVEEFKKTRAICGDNPLAKEIITFCKQIKLDVFLTTNPIFPYQGTLTRMGFVDLHEDDFKLITSYENSQYTKPNPKYFLNIMHQYGLRPEEVILFGNNVLEDGMCALKAGIKCYLVGNYIIENEKVDYKFNRIRMKDVIDIIKNEIESRK